MYCSVLYGLLCYLATLLQCTTSIYPSTLTGTGHGAQYVPHNTENSLALVPSSGLSYNAQPAYQHSISTRPYLSNTGYIPSLSSEQYHARTFGYSIPVGSYTAAKQGHYYGDHESDEHSDEWSYSDVVDGGEYETDESYTWEGDPEKGLPDYEADEDGDNDMDSESSDYSDRPMSNAARMLMYGGYQHHPQMYGYSQQQPVYYMQQQNPYGYYDMDKKKMKKHSYHDDDDDHHDDHYPKKKKKKKKKYYKPKKKKKKVKKVYVPIVIKKKKKKKRKTIAVYKGFYIPGGLQIFGKFKKMKDCKKACEITPNCFAADYNPWLKKCYVHTNVTACNNMRTHPKLIHFKKVPCDLLETPRGLIILGVRVHGGLEQKGIKNLQDCLKKCATAGQGIAPNTMPEEKARQICFGIDYDFATHKCYFHTDETLCPDVDPIPTPVQTVEAPSNILILLCPLMVV